MKQSRCLVVDDEKNLCAAFCCFLENDGYWVDGANSYNDAIALLEANVYDLIFTDISLGNNTGIDFLRHLRKKKVKCPAIIVTGYPDTETAVEAVRLGAYDYLVKPVLKDQLLKIARQASKYWDAKKAEHANKVQMEAMYHSIDAGLLVFDTDLHIIKCNDKVKTICAFQPHAAETCEFKHDSCLLNKSYSLVEEARKTGKVAKVNRYECNEKVFSLIATPLRAIDNRWMGTLLSVTDETRLHNMEKTLEGKSRFGRLVGKTPAMQKVYQALEALSSVPTTCLLYGESGTGKELAAEALHANSDRKDMPFIKVNCAALNDNLLDSELFGHVKGAFTGAHANRSGRFLMADGGTIFLDEIGDITPRMQVKLLRVLQEREIERLGSSASIKVNVRIIAATNKNLYEMVENGEFREDLYYRLSVFPVYLPALRDRRDDIPLLVDELAKELSVLMGRDHILISDKVMDTLLTYNWPGNIRELKNVLEHAFVQCTSDTICRNMLPDNLINQGTAKDKLKLTPEYIQSVLAAAGGNKAKTARLLGIDRKTLYNKLEQYNLS